MNTLLFVSFLFSLLSFAAALIELRNFISNVATNLTPAASDAEVNRTSFRLYTGNATTEYTSVLIGNASGLIPQMTLTKPTVFYIPGYTENPESTSVQTVMGAYLKRRDHNVILVDWQEIAAKPYPFAAEGAEKVGKAIAGAMDRMVASGLNSTTSHVVSHSLGSQVAGFMGRSTNIPMTRITGLDPAGPGFNFLIQHLTSTDAKFVDMIHTDAGGYGIAENDGTVNFHPNGGSRTQPGCPSIRILGSADDFCDHHRSWYYYAESVLNERAFIGVQCNSTSEFKSRSCSSNTKVVMGYATPTTASGKFYLQTNSKAPFGRGESGETYTA